MSVQVADLIVAMEAIAPTRFAASWDNVGLIVGDPSSSLSRALLTIDCTRAVVEEARRGGCGAIVSYHPPIFEGQRRFVAGAPAYDAARSAIAVFSPHTALDVAEGGTNDVLADALAMIERAPLRVLDEAARLGFGRIGAVGPASVRALVAQAKRALGVTHVLVAGEMDREVTRAAVCAGSGGEMVGDAIAGGAQLLLTGEVRHHDALRALAAGLVVVCARHSTSERGALASLQRRLAARLPSVAFVCSREDQDPFAFE
jgi:dinuclear metal center YbgI/SA1388 family protein